MSLDSGRFAVLHLCSLRAFAARWRHHRMLNLKIRSNLGFSPLTGDTMQQSRWNLARESTLYSSLWHDKFGPGQLEDEYGDQIVNIWNLQFLVRQQHTIRRSTWNSVRRVHQRLTVACQISTDRWSGGRWSPNIPQLVKREVSGHAGVTRCTHPG